MTNKRRLVIVVAALAICIATVIATVMLMSERPCLNKANFNKVQMGMTRDEVERVLGQPVGQEDRIDEGIVVVIWGLADRTQARVEFANGVVWDMAYEESTETVRDKLRRWTRVVR
jgi:hypothetical protein